MFSLLALLPVMVKAMRNAASAVSNVHTKELSLTCTKRARFMQEIAKLHVMQHNIKMQGMITFIRKRLA